MKESALTKTIMDLVRHAKVSDLESLDLAVLRHLENQANKDLDDANEMLDWILSIIQGTLKPSDVGNEMERKADLAVLTASNRRQWISSIINKKLGVTPVNNNRTDR